MLEEQNEWTTVRLFINALYDVTIHYVYIDEEQSIWDPEEKEYLWALRMEKISVYKAKAQFTIELKIQFDEDGNAIDADYIQYVDRPYEIAINTNNLVKMIYKGKLPSDIE